MKVAFDQQVFLLQEYGGISRYICGLAKHLAIIHGVEPRVIAPLHFNRNLDALRGVYGKGLFLPHVGPKSFRLVAMASKYLARLSITRFKPQILHETYFSFDSYLPRGAKRVVTVYDMIHERYSGMFERSHMTSGPKRSAAMRADHVLCISENTRRDLVEMFGIPENKVSVVHVGYDKLVPSGKLPMGTLQAVSKRYLLYVGGRDGYKNFKGLLHAYAISPFLKNNFSIVCFGGGPFNKEEMTHIRELGLLDTQISQIGGGDEVLADLYLDAAAFVYPSLYEGFGIPLLEAMSLGCPVICSNTSSFPEVAGDAGEYFNPSEIESIRDAIETVLQSETRRDDLIRKGRIRCTAFSWSRCADETLEIYRSLM